MTILQKLTTAEKAKYREKINELLGLTRREPRNRPASFRP